MARNSLRSRAELRRSWFSRTLSRCAMAACLRLSRTRTMIFESIDLAFLRTVGRWKCLFRLFAQLLVTNLHCHGLRANRSLLLSTVLARSPLFNGSVLAEIRHRQGKCTDRAIPGIYGEERRSRLAVNRHKLERRWPDIEIRENLIRMTHQSSWFGCKTCLITGGRDIQRFHSILDRLKNWTMNFSFSFALCSWTHVPMHGYANELVSWPVIFKWRSILVTLMSLCIRPRKMPFPFHSSSTRKVRWALKPKSFD